MNDFHYPELNYNQKILSSYDVSDILTRCQELHENDEHDQIIAIVEEILEKHTLELGDVARLHMELARAYNNKAVFSEPMDKSYLEKAINLFYMHPELEDDYSYNFRFAYAYFYNDMEEKALPLFKKALQIYPKYADYTLNTKDDIKYFIELCENQLFSPWDRKPFSQRVEEGWTKFSELESNITKHGEDILNQPAEYIGEIIDDVLDRSIAKALKDIDISVGFDDESHKFQLTFSIGSNLVKLAEIDYFLSKVPEELKTRWDFEAGSPSIGDDFRFDGEWISLSTDEVYVTLNPDEEGYIDIGLYCNRLLDEHSNDDSYCLYVLTQMLEQTLGELVAIKYIKEARLLKDMPTVDMIKLSDLRSRLIENGYSLELKAEDILYNSYFSYDFEPYTENVDFVRSDIISGITAMPIFVSDFMGYESSSYDTLFANGAVAGFIAIPNQVFSSENDNEEVLKFRREMEVYLTEKVPDCKILGGATGVFYTYIDFIGWNPTEFMDTAHNYLFERDIVGSFFHPFRADGYRTMMGAVEIIP